MLQALWALYKKPDLGSLGDLFIFFFEKRVVLEIEGGQGEGEINLDNARFLIPSSKFSKTLTMIYIRIFHKLNYSTFWRLPQFYTLCFDNF